MLSTVKERLIRSTKWNFFGYVLLLGGGLVLTRYIIQNIGKDRFGIWIVAESVILYFGLFDCGIRTSFVKYIATFRGKGDNRSVNHLINTGFIFYLCFSVGIYAGGVLLFPLLLPFLFKVTPQYVEEARFVFTVVLFVFALEHAMRPFTAVLGGLQRYDIENKIRIACFIFYIAGVVYALQNGFGLRGLVVASAAQVALQNVIAIVYSFKLLPSLRFNPLLFRWGFMKLMFMFGIKLQVLKLEELIMFYTDTIVLTRFLGAGLVTFYALGFKIASQARRLCLILDSVIVPATSELDARSDPARIEALYYRATKYLCFAGYGTLGYVIVSAPLIMRLWMGEGYGLSVLTMRLLALSFFISIFAKIARSITIGINRMGFYLVLSVVHAVLNLGLSIWLVLRIGFPGVLIGTLVSFSITSVLFVVLFHRMLGFSLGVYARRIWLKAGLAAALPAALIMAANRYIWRAVSMTIPACLVIFLAEGAVFFAVYLAVIWRSRFFDAYDVDVIHEKIPLSRKLRLLT